MNALYRTSNTQSGSSLVDRLIESQTFFIVFVDSKKTISQRALPKCCFSFSLCKTASSKFKSKSRHFSQTRIPWHQSIPLQFHPQHHQTFHLNFITAINSFFTTLIHLQCCNCWRLLGPLGHFIVIQTFLLLLLNLFNNWTLINNYEYDSIVPFNFDCISARSLRFRSARSSFDRRFWTPIKKNRTKNKKGDTMKTSKRKKPFKLGGILSDWLVRMNREILDGQTAGTGTKPLRPSNAGNLVAEHSKIQSTCDLWLMTMPHDRMSIVSSRARLFVGVLQPVSFDRRTFNKKSGVLSLNLQLDTELILGTTVCILFTAENYKYTE